MSIQPAGSVLGSSASASRAGVLLSALQPPAPSRATVVRKELLDRLLDDASAKLVLVVAPAGWGKTSLLRDWCASGEASATAWLSADGADNDPARFWAGVIAALRTVCPGVGAAALEMLKAPGGNAADGVLPSLINDLAGAAGRLTLVIDDFHLITSEEIKQGFGFLVDHLPVTLGLMVAARCDPDLPLARMRARGELAEFRADDLRFSETETADLLNGTLGLALPPDDVHALRERTEGWAAGLYLAALSLRGREDVARGIPEITGETRQMVDYFAAEVLADQPAEVRSFLLRTSVLNGFCASLCDAVAGPADSDGSAGSQRLLEQLERSQLFLVPLDSTRQWYRYHTLFAEWLRHELARSEPGLAAELHRRASAWHREHGSVTEAIDHAICAGQLADARDLIAAHWQPLLNEGLPETVDSWLDRLPAQMVAEDARMCMIRAWLARFLGRLDEVEPWLAAAKAAAPGGPCPAGPSSMESAASMLRSQSGHMTGDLALAESASRRAVELEAAGADRWRAAALALLGISLFWRGDAAEASRLFTQVVDPTRPPASNLASVWALGYRAAISARDGDLESAERDLRDVQDLAADHGLGRYWMMATAITTSAELLAARGRPGEAKQCAMDALALARRGRARPETAHALLCLAKISSRARHSDEARAYIGEARDVIARCADPGILSDMLAEAEQAADLRAAGLRAAGLPAAASATSPGSPTAPVTDMVEPLTSREREVLDLLAEGRSNRGIADQLVVTLDTVKRHVSHILAKLGAVNRTEAVARARGRNLIG